MSMTLKAARVNAGLTQIQFAEKLGVSEDTVRRYETGKSFPDVAMLERIKAVTGVGYDDLIFLKSIPVKPEKEA